MQQASKLSPEMPCPCGSGLGFGDCCQPLLSGAKKADSAPALMRSRFCAFLLKQSAYLHKTHHPSTMTPALADNLARQANPPECWHKLDILDYKHEDNEAFVEFKAIYSRDHKPGLLHERSRFVFEKGQWFYIDGEHVLTPFILPARNAPCWCNSMRKFKHCHGKTGSA